MGHMKLDYLAHAYWISGTPLVQFWQRRGPYLGRQTQSNLDHSSADYQVPLLMVWT